MNALTLALYVMLVLSLGLLAVPVLVFAMQVFAAQAPRSPVAGHGWSVDAGRSAYAADNLARGRLAVLVPAHNEASGIERTLSDVMAQLQVGDRVLVVADNCTDATARVALECGADVIERHDTTRRGKGYALDFGIRHLAADPPSALCIVDADCRLAPRCLHRLAVASETSGRPVQGLYLMHAPVDAALRMRVAAFAWRVKNWVRPLGALRMGAACPLMGTGMAFPWELISRAALAHGHLVEDMKLGVDFAHAKVPPLFVPSALIESMFPVTTKSATAQRERWEHGHLATLLAEGPKLLLGAVRAGDARAMAMALDLMVPPLTLLVGLVGLAFVLAAGMTVVASSVPLWIAAGCAATLGLALTRAWWLVGRPLLSVTDLVRAPAYAFWKLPVYLKFVTQRQKAWVRTERDDEKL